MPWQYQLFFLVVFLGPAVYFTRQDDLISAVACVATCITAFAGYRAGAAWMLSIVVAGIAIITFAPSIGIDQEARISQWFGTSGLTNRIISVTLAGILIGVLSLFASNFIFSRVLARKPKLESINRWLGFSLGAVEGLLGVTLFLSGILMLQPTEKESDSLPNAGDENAFQRFIQDTREQTRRSRIGPALDTYNPVESLTSSQPFEEIQRLARLLEEPSQIQELLDNPEIQRLRERPDIQRVISQLESDPDVQEILNSQTPISRESLLTLMNHPSVLELLDQPGFVEEAAKVIRNSNLVQPSQN